MEFLIANLAPIMFATLIGFLLLGFPVAFALAANGILFGLVGMELGLLNSSCSRRCRSGCSASFPTTRCWRCRSSR